MKILLLGSGGREHALAWKIVQSPKVDKLYIAPGNAGTKEVGENVNIKVTDFDAIADFVLANGVSMVVVGPEDPLVKGVYDYFQADERLKNIAVIGPTKAAAELEGSKNFAKEFMQRHAIPTAAYKAFTAAEKEDAYRFLESLKAPYVLKADGLCAGKGVLILPTLEEAKKSLDEMLDGMFGDSSATVVIEEFLDGIECSVFVLTDGKDYVILPEAKDYKRIGEGNTGLNTGGMGSISPVPFATPEWMKKVEDRIIKPTVDGLVKDIHDTIRKTPGMEDALFVIVSDHGQEDIDRTVNLTELLQKYGWGSDRLGVQSCGMSAYFFIDDEDDIPAVKRLLTDHAQEFGVTRVFDSLALDRMGCIAKVDLAVEGMPGVVFSDALDANKRHAATHGFAPGHAAENCFFAVCGNGIPGGKTLPSMPMRDVAPTVAGLMGISLPEAEGDDHTNRIL